MSFSLSARNLAIAEKTGLDVVAPCSACYLVLLKAMNYIKEYPAIRKSVNEALTAAGHIYRGTTRVRHPLEVLLNDVGFETIQNKTKLPLRSFKIAPYYGCQIVRPFEEFDHHTYPDTMDHLFEIIGANVIDYTQKTRCCGGSLTGTIEEVGLRLNYILLKEAHEKGANCIATVCPLCQFNLEAYQRKILKKYNNIPKMPILYFSQVLGLALGIDKDKLGMKKSIIYPKELMDSLVIPEVSTTA
jgi:heterodisulfide reductase subunit B